MTRASSAGLAMMLVCLETVPAHAFLGLEKFWSKPPETPRVAQAKAPLPGQKSVVLKPAKSNAADLYPALLNYVESIHSQGSLVLDTASNTITSTDDPDIVARLQALMRAMDRPYDKPSPKVRQVLALQQMRRALREMGPEARPIPGASIPSTAAAAPGVPQRPVPAKGETYQGQPAVPAAPAANAFPTGAALLPKPWISEEKGNAPLRRIMEEKPTLPEFHLIGWVSDRQGTIVVLRAQGQRYIYHHGIVHYNSLASKSLVEGLQGTIRDNHLVLTDAGGRSVALNMLPEPSQQRSAK